MLSKKMTFSLMSLITLLAFAFVIPSAMAQKEFSVDFEGRTAVNVDATVATVVTLKVTTGQPVSDDTTGDIDLALTADVFDKNGFAVDYTVTIADDATFDAMKTAMVRRFTISLPAITVADQGDLPYTIYITVPALTTNNPTVATTDMANMSKIARHTITLSASVDTTGLPKVVSVQRLRPGSQTVVAAFQEVRIPAEPFNVRIVLTEHPNGPDPLNAVNLIAVENGVPSDLVVGTTFLRRANAAGDADSTILPHPIEGMYEHSGEAGDGLAGVPNAATTATDTVPLPTSPDGLYRQYRVTITPHIKSVDFDVKISVKPFHDAGTVVRNTYLAPAFADSGHLPNGREILTVPVSGAARNLKAGYRVRVKKDVVIPAGGYLVISKDVAGSEVEAGPGPAGEWRINDTPRPTHRTPEQLKYNVIDEENLHDDDDLPNLATQFLTGVVVDVESQHPLVVSEVMWGEDTSLNPSSKSQYIELYNPGGQHKTADDADHTPDVNEALTLIFYASNEFDDIPARGTDGSLPAGVTDRIGTLDVGGDYWEPISKGQSGRSGTIEDDTGELTTGRGVFVDAVPIVSMYRVIEEGVAVLAADKIVVAFEAEYATDGQVAAGWASSEGPKSANFDPLAIGVRHGTPGAATDATTTPADTAAEEKAAADKAAAALKKTESTGTMPENGQIYISEVMFAGGGTLPQWIEIANGSKSEEVNLSGWTLTVDNAAADADVSIGASATFTIADGTTIDPSGQIDTPSTVLIVTEAGRYDLGKGASQIIDLMKDNEVDLINAGVVKRKYTLLSSEAFSITLAPPEPEKSDPPADETAAAKAIRSAAETEAANDRKAATDTVGNLDADGGAAWALPTDESVRSSIIRRHVQVSIGPAEPEDGTMAANWVLASDTAFAQPTHIRTVSFYGARSDIGTPGFRAGGALPVQLSQFRPARDKETGAVVITWSTQSELNNAGFFIKRSQQRDGEFKIINAAMIPGAGTTSEKQFYTYNDTTAQPNVVYYYQIEDVSLDGNRQTLTNGIRLKGHISVAGKLTTTWGDLKTSQ